MAKDVYLSCGVRQVSDSKDKLPQLFAAAFDALLKRFGKSYGGRRLDAVVITSAHPQELCGLSPEEIVKQFSLLLREKNLNLPVFYSHKPGIYNEDANLPASAAGAHLLHEGIQAVAFGKGLEEGKEYETIALIAAEQMLGVKTQKSIEVLRSLIHPEEAKFGLTMPALGAIQSMISTKRDPIFPPAQKFISSQHHTFGADNPRAQLKKAFSVEEYQAKSISEAPAPDAEGEEAASAPQPENRLVSSPLRLWDVPPRSAGYAGVIVSTRPPSDDVKVRVAAYGQGIDTLAFSQRKNHHESLATLTALEQVKEMIDLTKVNVRYAEVHDAFAVVFCQALQDTSLLNMTGITNRIIQGETGPEGRLPANLSGGLLCGHALAASGLGQIVELLLQAQGEAEIKVKDLEYPHYSMAVSVAGMNVYNFLTLLEASREVKGEFDLKPIPEVTREAFDTSYVEQPNEPFHARVLCHTTLYYPPKGFSNPLTIAMCFSPVTRTKFFAISATDELQEGQFVTVTQDKKGRQFIESARPMGQPRPAPKPAAAPAKS